MFKKKPIILPKGIEAYDPKEKEKQKWINERKKEAERIAKIISDFLVNNKDEFFNLIDVANACQVIAKKIIDHIDKAVQETETKAQELLENAYRNESTKALDEIYEKTKQPEKREKK